MSQYVRPGVTTTTVVNDVISITTPQGTFHPSGCSCSTCAGGGYGPQGAQGITGAQGPAGPQGTQGLIGPAGAGAQTLAYLHIQGSASNTWVIAHNLGFHPNVTVQDSAGNIVEGEITYTNTNSLTASFASAFSGKAYLS